MKKTIEYQNTRNEGGLRKKGFEKNSIQGQPLVTVITVVYNGVATIAHTIRSVIEQTYDNIEHIIIDGGSTDATLDVLRKYESNIDYWLSEKDEGMYDAMNKGISLARGDFIGLLNSDDFFAGPSSLEKIVTRLMAKDIDAVFSCLDIIDSTNLDRVLRKYRISRLSSSMLRIGLMPAHPTFYCKKSFYQRAEPYRTDYSIAADFEMLVRLFLKHCITWDFIDETTVKMRSGGVSNRGIKSNWLVNREIIRACTENGLYTNMFMLALKVPIRLIERIR